MCADLLVVDGSLGGLLGYALGHNRLTPARGAGVFGRLLPHARLPSVDGKRKEEEERSLKRVRVE